MCFFCLGGGPISSCLTRCLTLPNSADRPARTVYADRHADAGESHAFLPPNEVDPQRDRGRLMMQTTLKLLWTPFCFAVWTPFCSDNSIWHTVGSTDLSGCVERRLTPNNLWEDTEKVERPKGSWIIRIDGGDIDGGPDNSEQRT